MVGELIGKGLCNLGIHKVDDWTFRRSKSCIQDGGCQRCGASRDRLFHNYEQHLKVSFWEDVYWECTRCGEEDRPPNYPGY